MSADVLRRAATVLREAAETATPGPWVGYDGGEVATDWHPLGAEWQNYRDDLQIADDVFGPNATYIALMHPLVGKALADWLDVMSRRWGSSLPASVESEALAVARAVLGEAS